MRWWVLLLPCAVAAPCLPEEVHYGLSQCSPSTDELSVYFYAGRECEAGDAVRGVSCNSRCDQGEFLDFDRATGGLKCSLCPAGTYSSGGGVHFGSTGQDWQSAKDFFVQYCAVAEKSAWVMDANCSSWEKDANGLLRSGRTDARKWLKSELVYSANIVKPGSLSLRYHSQTRIYNGVKNGLFELYLNSFLVLSISETGKTPWRTFNSSLSPGLFEAKLVYTMYNAEGYENLAAEISDFQVGGVEYYSTTCEKCRNGVSEMGASACQPCPVSYYFEEGICVPCPPGTHSPSGSLSSSACQVKQPCTVHDYSPQHTGCSYGKRTRYYIWNIPVICDLLKGVPLPANETGISCDICPAGSHYAARRPDNPELVCVACPPGTAVTQHRATDECGECPEGTYSLSWVNITHWSSSKDKFTNECQPFVGQQCSFAQGWVVNGDSLSSGRLGEHDSYLVFSINVDIVEMEAFAQFRYSLLDVQTEKTTLRLEIDGNLALSYNQNGWEETSTPVPLTLGLHSLQLIYHHSVQALSPHQDLAFIHWFAVRGTAQGGAPTCQPCPPGQISNKGSSTCMKCPLGFIPDSKAAHCYSCPENTYQDGVGAAVCKQCSEQTIPNHNLTYCVSTNALRTNNTEYSISNLTGIRGAKEGYTLGVCANDWFKLLCKETFYGPVHSHEGSFYVSVMNPSHLSFDMYEESDNPRIGYAYGLLERPGMRKKGLGELCVKDFGKVLVNLGSVIGTVDVGETGFNVTYVQGAVCDAPSSVFFSSILQFSCDKSEEDGFPEFLSSSHCSFTFHWRTRHACRICRPSELTLIISDCYSGVRYLYYIEAVDCIRNPDTPATFTERCSIGSEIIRTNVFVVLMLFLAAMITIGIISLGCYCSIKKKYNRLRLRERTDVVVSTHQGA